jgi:hypothetical protein
VCANHPFDNLSLFLDRDGFVPSVEAPSVNHSAGLLNECGRRCITFNIRMNMSTSFVDVMQVQLISLLPCRLIFLSYGEGFGCQQPSALHCS